MVQSADIIGTIGCARVITVGVIFFGIRYANGRRRRSEAHRHLAAMLQSFVFQGDRSERRVQAIFQLLTQHFQGEPDYERLATAVSSFAPGSQPPFLNEKQLAAEFRHFLKMPPEDEEAWPPPPQRRPEAGT